MSTSRRQFLKYLGFLSFAWSVYACREVTVEVEETAGPQPGGPTPTPGPGQGYPQTGIVPGASPTPGQNLDGVPAPPEPPKPTNGPAPTTNPTPPGPTSVPQPTPPPTGGPTVTMQDLKMEGWSTLGSGFLGNNGTLKATMIRDNQVVTLNYIQDPHGHKFTLTKDHFLKLRQGIAIEVLSSEAQGHKHIVKINPRNVVAGSAGITMPVNLP